MNPGELNFPDPTEGTSAANTKGADDVVGHLPAQDIDRLLAEVDEKFDARLGRTSAPPATSSTLVLRRYPAPKIADAPEPDLNDFFNDLNKAPRRRRDLLPSRPEPTLEEEMEAETTALERRVL